MPVTMPQFDDAVLARRAEIVAALKRIVPGEGVIASEHAMRPYESDGLTAYRQLPMVVVLPETTAQVAAVLGYCHREGIKVVPRGAGTSLSGGALPLGDGVLLGMAKFNRIREIDFDNRVAVVEPGVTNLAVSQAVEQAGFYYAPDPSSQIACTIGGNVAENSGGVHCLKYGVTTNNVLGCELVLMTGEIVRLGGKHLDSGGYDLLGIVTGSEGLLGVVTEVTVRILKKPQSARAALIGFTASEDGGECVARIIGAGIIPGGMEMMDRPGDSRRRGIRPCRLSARRRGAADRRARRPARRGRSPARARPGDRQALPRGDLPRLQFRGRAAAVLGRPQGGVPGGRPHLAGLLLHGRHHPAREIAAGAAAHAGAVGEIRLARRQRVPCRRRQSASADPLRRQQARRARARRTIRRRYSAAVRRGRRRAHRRARRRRRKARPDAGDVFARPISTSSSGSNAPSTTRACSIPAKCSRRCIAAPSSAACTCMPGGVAFPDIPRF